MSRRQRCSLRRWEKRWCKSLLERLDDLRTVLACVERILSEGDDMAKDVVATGFLEALVAAEDLGQPGSSRLMGFLGPLARAYCSEWKAFTEGR